MEVFTRVTSPALSEGTSNPTFFSCLLFSYLRSCASRPPEIPVVTIGSGNATADPAPLYCSSTSLLRRSRSSRIISRVRGELAYGLPSLMYVLCLRLRRGCVNAASGGTQTQIRPVVISAAPHRRISGWLYVTSGLLVVRMRTTKPTMLNAGALETVRDISKYRDRFSTVPNEEFC